MHWREFQNTADRLAQQATEGDWRSAISRGYYAVFHYFREFLLAHGLDIGQGGVAHSNLYMALWNCGFPLIAPIAARIDDLRILRGKADYDLWRVMGQSMALSAVAESRAIVTDFQAVLAAIAPRDIADGARHHLQAIGRLGKTP